MFLRAVLNNITNIKLARCYLCQLPTPISQLICQPCFDFFKPNNHACQKCAMPLAAITQSSCGHCQKTHWHIDNTYAPWQNCQPIKQLIRDFKYKNAIFLADFLARCMQNIPLHHLQRCDYLIPMPIHPKRLRERGYNQTILLAKIIQQMTAIPMNLSVCQRTRYLSPQVKLNQQERKKNMRASFSSKLVSNQHLVIIDDLITTGSTANELAKTLKKQGAKQVDLWCIARNT